MIYDLIIIGSGPAGLTAAIYGERARLETLTIEHQPMSGGQILNTYEVDNYPGFPGIGGFELGQAFREHAEKLGATFQTAEVITVKNQGKFKEVVTSEGSFQTRTVIIATGASHRKLGIPGEEELGGMGVSYCATCDGAFFKGRTVAVAGGGDVALEDALFLARGCEKVYLIHRRDEFRGAKVLQEQVKTAANIEILYDTVINRIEGTDQVEAIDIYNKKKEEQTILKVDGVFIAVGIVPQTGFLGDLVEKDESGYVVADEEGRTGTAGVFVAGDVRTKQLRQVVTAAADGANAVHSAEKYIRQEDMVFFSS